MKAVYLLEHSYPLGEDKFFDEVRIIGLYSSRKKAKEALLKYMTKKGFKFHIDGFYISKLKIDENFKWVDGFFTIMI